MQRRYPCNTLGTRTQCYPSLQGAHLRIYGSIFSGFRSLTPRYAVLVQCESFCPNHLPVGDAYIFPLSLSYDPLPLQNFASLKGLWYTKYGDVHEKFNFLEIQEIRPLRTCQKHFGTILPNFLLDESAI